MEVVDLTEEPTKLDRDVRKKVEKAIARDKWGKVEKMVERGEVGVDTMVGKKSGQKIPSAQNSSAYEINMWVPTNEEEAQILLGARRGGVRGAAAVPHTLFHLVSAIAMPLVPVVEEEA